MGSCLRLSAEKFHVPGNNSVLSMVVHPLELYMKNLQTVCLEYIKNVIRLERTLATAQGRLLVVNEFRKAAQLLNGVKVTIKYGSSGS